MYFLKKYKNRMMVTLVAIILIVIIGVTSNSRPQISGFENTVGNLLSPLNKISFNIREKAFGFFGTIKNLSGLLEENEGLKTKIMELEDANRDLENIIGKSDYLKNELELLKSTEHNVISAEIIGKEPGDWYDTFMIDKGLKDNVKKGDTIVQGIEVEKGIIKEGIVGRVADVGNDWAKVVSIVDEMNSIAFKIIRTQDGGIVSGDIDYSVSGYLFDSKADVIVGDRLYTSGLGGIFKKDIYIGEVEDVIELEEELMKKVVVKPAVNFKKLYKVLVILDWFEGSKW